MVGVSGRLQTRRSRFSAKFQVLLALYALFALPQAIQFHMGLKGRSSVVGHRPLKPRRVRSNRTAPAKRKTADISQIETINTLDGKLRCNRHDEGDNIYCMLAWGHKGRHMAWAPGTKPKVACMWGGKPAPGTPGGGVLSQGITLHGIKTRMLDHSEYNYHLGVSCPCGWKDRMWDWTMIGNEEYERILQFHFTHCKKARFK